MKTIKEFMFGISRYQKAVYFSRENGLGGYFIVSVLANLCILALIWFFLWGYAGRLGDFLEMKLGLGLKEGWWWKALDYLLSFVLYVFVLLVYVKLYKAVVLTLTSPVLAMVAEKVQCKLLGVPEPAFDWGRLVSDIKRGLLITFKNLAYEIGIVLGLMVLSLFIPPISMISPLILISVESYYHGFSMIDYRNEFLRMGEPESRALINKHKGFSVGIGFTFYLLLLIPVLGALFAPILGVVAAGIGIHELDKGE